MTSNIHVRRLEFQASAACLDRHGFEIVGREEGCFSSPRFGRGFQARRVWSLISALGLGFRKV